MGADRDGTHVAIWVRDEGRGIEPERIPQLFRKHGGDGSGGVGGGLGLAICKGLVEAHGGRIRAESDGPGQGACFTFTVPVAAEPDRRRERRRAGRSRTRTRTVRRASSSWTTTRQRCASYARPSRRRATPFSPRETTTSCPTSSSPSAPT